MEFSVKSGNPEKQRSACIVVGVFEPRRLSGVAEQLDKVSDGYLSNLLRRGDLEGKSGQVLLLHHLQLLRILQVLNQVSHLIVHNSVLILLLILLIGTSKFLYDQLELTLVVQRLLQVVEQTKLVMLCLLPIGICGKLLLLIQTQLLRLLVLLNIKVFGSQQAVTRVN